jgi:hypothetical protein
MVGATSPVARGLAMVALGCAFLVLNGHDAANRSVANQTLNHRTVAGSEFPAATFNEVLVPRVGQLGDHIGAQRGSGSSDSGDSSGGSDAGALADGAARSLSIKKVARSIEKEKKRSKGKKGPKMSAPYEEADNGDETRGADADGPTVLAAPKQHAPRSREAPPGTPGYAEALPWLLPPPLPPPPPPRDEAWAGGAPEQFVPLAEAAAAGFNAEGGDGAATRQPKKRGRRGKGGGQAAAATDGTSSDEGSSSSGGGGGSGDGAFSPGSSFERVAVPQTSEKWLGTCPAAKPVSGRMKVVSTDAICDGTHDTHRQENHLFTSRCNVLSTSLCDVFQPLCVLCFNLFV